MTTTVAIPRPRNEAIGRIHVGSVEDVMTIAVIPRRNRLAVVTRVSTSGVEPSPSTAARSCMILRCWRLPRSAGRTPIRWALTVRPTARFSRIALSAIDGRDPDGRLDGRFVAAPGLGRAVEVEDDPGIGRLLELELLHLDLAVAGGGRQWMRLKLSPGAHGRTVVASGVVWSVRSGEEWAPSTLAAGRRHSGSALDPRVDDDGHALADRGRRLEEPERIARPDLERLDPEVAAPGERGADEPRPLRRASPSEIARPGSPPGSVVGLWTSSHGFGTRLVLRSV